MRRLLASPAYRVVGNQLGLFHLVGRRSGKRYTIPVGLHWRGDQVSVLTNSPWRASLRGGADLEVTIGGKRRPVHAELVEDVDEVARFYAEEITRMGWQPAQRRLGIRITVGRPPTLDELRAAVRTEGLSLVRLELR